MSGAAPSSCRAALRWYNLGVLAGCLALVIYIGVLLGLYYRAQAALRETALENVRLDVVRHAATISYFLDERRNDLNTIVSEMGLAGSLTGNPPGKTGRKPSAAGLVAMDLLYRDILAKKTLGGAPVYERIRFFDAAGNLLVDTSDDDGSTAETWQIPPPVGGGEVGVLLEESGSTVQLLLSAPFYVKGSCRGQVLATIAPLLFEHLLPEAGAGGYGFRIVADDGRMITGRNGDEELGADAVLLDLARPTGQFWFFDTAIRDSATVSMAALKVPIEQAPLGLLFFAPAEHLFSKPTPWQLLIVAGPLALVMLGVVTLLLRTKSQNLLLKVRIDMSDREKDRLACKNNDLVGEVEMRRRMVDELCIEQRQLEERAEELRQSMERTYTLAYFDTLTGLPNRELCMDRIRQALASARRNHASVALLFLDLDRFKEVNDSLGHANGDALLKAVAERLRACVRDEDTVARFGGDEFVILLPALRRGCDVTAVAQKLLEAMSASINLEGHEVFITTSIGIALFPEDGDDAQLLLKHADLAMYSAKDQGRNTLEFYSSDLNSKALQQRDMEAGLRKALDRGELFLVYQPQYDMQTGKTLGFEALVRWRHPRKGVLLPQHFIPLAEDGGLIHAIGRWVLRTACAQAQAWRSAGLDGFRMAVNLSGRQIRQPELSETVSACLRDTALPAAFLELELAEKAIIETPRENLQALAWLQEQGVTITIDDFGAGYSSLSYLKGLPVDRIKIAKRFVRDVLNNPNDAAIVEVIIALAASLGIDVLAEGVENRAQLEFLLHRQCRSMQGFYLSPPMEVAALTTELLRGATDAESEGGKVEGGGLLNVLRDGLNRGQPHAFCVP